MRLALPLLLMSLAAAVAACGSTVVEDDDDGASNGDATSGPDDDGSSATGDPEPSQCLSAPVPVGSIGACSPATDLDACRANRCTDDSNTEWSVVCNEHTCNCKWANTTVCSCAVTGGVGSICSGEIAPCCPAPWVSP